MVEYSICIVDAPIDIGVCVEASSGVCVKVIGGMDDRFDVEGGIDMVHRTVETLSNWSGEMGIEKNKKTTLMQYACVRSNAERGMKVIIGGRGDLNYGQWGNGVHKRIPDEIRHQRRRGLSG